MKLKDVVEYLNLLDTFSTSVECNNALRVLDGIKHVVSTHALQWPHDTQTLDKDFNTVSSGMNNFQTTLENLRQRLRDEIAKQEGEYFRESLRLFNHDMIHETNDYILDRRLGIDSDSNILLRSHLRSLSDWRTPGLIFRPGRETFIEDMVPLDPLYLADQHLDLLKHSVSSFNPDYQRRLQQYVVNDRSHNKFLIDLPQNQFGLVFAYNFFNFKPIEIIRQYLTELYDKMRPGGTLLMTYNNCDRAQGVGLVERGFMCYTPKRYIQNHAETVGFDLSFSHDGAGDLSWLEFVKPGHITSLRGGQTLAKIFAKTD